MKSNLKLLIMCSAIIISNLVQAQNFISGAESVAFDTLNNRYLVSSLNNQKIIAIDPSGTQSIYKEQIGAFGNCIKDNVFYVSGGNTKRVIGIDLVTDQKVMDVIFPNTLQIDGVTTDEDGNLYVVETRLGFIYKLNLNDLSQSVLTSTGSGAAPQDIIYDKFQDRLLLCYWHLNSPVVSIDPVSGVLDTVVVTDTGFFDGITIDDAGNVYLASHVDGGQIVMYDNDYTNGGHIIYEGIDEPAGLDYNFRDGVLAVPSFAGSDVVFIDLPATYLNVRFDSDIKMGHAPLNVEFINKSNSSEPTITYEWDFNNDGITDSFEENPSFTYNDTGSYSIKLVVTADTMSREIIYENYINVFDGETALEFSTVTDRVEVEANSSLNLGSAWTFEMWTKPTTLARKRLLDKNMVSVYTNRNATSTLNPFSLAAKLYLANGASITVSTPDSSFVENKWQHAAIVYNYDEKLLQMYINGINQELDISSDELFDDVLRDNAADNLVIGNSKLFSSAFIGLMDNVRVWSTARTEENINELMSAKLTGNEEGLISGWDFNEGNGFKANDISANKNNGIVEGAQYVQSVDFTTITSAADYSNHFVQLPDEFSLIQNYPNPFNPSTRINFNLHEPESVTLQIISTTGEIVRTLISENLSAGTHSLTWSGENDFNLKVSSGVYIYRLIAGHKEFSKKMLMLK